MTTVALINQVNGWWDSLDLARQVFYGIGIVAGLTSIIMAVLSFIGMEHQDAVDASDALDADHGGGGIFSIKPLTGFFLGFGWVGGMLLDAGQSLMLAILIAGLTGAAFMALVLAMFRAIYRMRSDGTVRIEDAMGAIGTVYVTIPPQKAAGGQVVVNFSGRQETLAALTGGERAIASGEKIKVLGVIDGRTVLVDTL